MLENSQTKAEPCCIFLQPKATLYMLYFMYNMLSCSYFRNGGIIKFVGHLITWI